MLHSPQSEVEEMWTNALLGFIDTEICFTQHLDFQKYLNQLRSIWQNVNPPSHPALWIPYFSHLHLSIHFPPYFLSLLLHHKQNKTPISTNINLILSFFLLSSPLSVPIPPSFPFSHKHETILSYPALAWENHKKNDKRPRKEQEKWCESESRAEVMTGESGQEGRRVRARGWERAWVKEKMEAGVFEKKQYIQYERCQVYYSQRRKENVACDRWSLGADLQY